MPNPEIIQTLPPAQRHIPTPAYRRLRGYAFDPSISTQLENLDLNAVTFKVRWEAPRAPAGDGGAEQGALSAGPIGEYLEVVDYDPASGCFYQPVDLNDPLLLAQDGLPPSEGNPQFHQQMVYAVAMTTIQHFERALGRPVLWRPLQPDDAGFAEYDDSEDEPPPAEPAAPAPTGERKKSPAEKYVKRLRIYPHALRQANAFYSPNKRALLFGYFTASPEVAGLGFPGGTVFTCLSHDVIAHETTHALLDGTHAKFIEPTQPDTLAFHEAFADIVALFQHFSFPEVVRGQIARARGDLESQNLLGQLAQEVGMAVGQYGALRDAIGEIDPETKTWRLQRPDPHALENTDEPHARGAILVAAVFNAFLAIYKSRVVDLLRIASSGTGILPVGALHPDLVTRLAGEAARAAQQVLEMCIRALDYCAPVDITFGDYLRALITADSDLVPDDDRGYRVAVLDAFRRRGIYPENIRTLSVESLRWPLLTTTIFEPITKLLRGFQDKTRYSKNRREIFEEMGKIRARLHDFLQDEFAHVDEFEELTGLILTPGRPLPGDLGQELTLRQRRGKPSFQVHSLRPAVRVGPDGNILNQMIISIVQTCDVNGQPGMRFRGGCTLILDLGSLDVRYCIAKKFEAARWRRQHAYWTDKLSASLRATYFGNPYNRGLAEPFSLLHSIL